MAVPDWEMAKRRIRDAVDIVQLIGRYVALRQAGASWKGLCPFHPEKTPSFTVSPARQTFKCFGCGAGGDIFTFVQKKENVEFPEAMRMLAEQAGITLEERGDKPSGPGKTDLIKANQWAAGVFRRLFESAAGEEARGYAQRRGISPEIIAAFELGLAPDGHETLLRQARTARLDVELLVAAGLVKQSTRGGHYDTFRNRLMFPIRDPMARVIGFGGRTLADDPAKYLNSPATAVFDKSTCLFGLDRARQAIGTKKRAIVVEGYTDCIMAHQHGYEETVATLGTAMTASHAETLRRYSERVILLFDSDEAGQRAASRALSVTVSGQMDVLLTRVPEGKDPCDYLLAAGQEGFDRILTQAVGALEFRWNQVLSEYQAGQTGPSRRRAIETFVKDVSGWMDKGAVDPIARGLLVNQLSLLLGLSASEVSEMLRQPQHARQAAPPIAGGAAARAWRTGGRTPTGGADQTAYRQIIEVLLNEPGLYGQAAADMDLGAIRDAALASVADALVQLLETQEEFDQTELIRRLGSEEAAALITELAECGRRRGAYEVTIEGAVACLRGYQQSREALVMTQALRQGRHEQQAGNRAAGEPSTAREDEDQRLRALAAKAGQSNFASLRQRRRFLQD